MRIDEYAARDGLALAALVRSGDASAEEIEDAAQRAIAALNPRLNFLAGTIDPPYRAASPNPDSAFAGVPLLIKDIGAAIAGVPQELGSLLSQGVRPTEDSELVRRFAAAGMQILGRSTTPELGSAFSTEPRMTGPTRNPWNPGRSPGGSSGGAAAAVAAGAVPIAHAGDSAGSIRIPAHCCGVFGLKPTRGRVPTGPQSGEVYSGLTAGHVITRSVRDSAATLDAIAGADPGCRYAAAPPASPFLAAVTRPLPPLRIAICTESPFAARLDREVAGAVEETARLLETMGHEIEPVRLSFDAGEALDNLAVIWSVNIRHAVGKLEAATGRTANGDTLEGATLAMTAFGAGLSAEQLLQAFDWMNSFSRLTARQFEGYDALVAPCFVSPAPPTGLLSHDRPVEDLREFLAELFGHAAYTVQYNLTGQPAMSVPLHMSADGLPIGTQIVGRSGGEETLFALAGALEQARPWGGRIPPVSVFEPGHAGVAR